MRSWITWIVMASPIKNQIYRPAFLFHKTIGIDVACKAPWSSETNTKVKPPPPKPAASQAPVVGLLDPLEQGFSDMALELCWDAVSVAENPWDVFDESENPGDVFDECGFLPE